jgi:hypothetical protein
LFKPSIINGKQCFLLFTYVLGHQKEFGTIMAFIKKTYKKLSPWDFLKQVMSEDSGEAVTKKM